MHIVVQACILGVLTGGVYALMASGLTLVFGVMRVINVAQGALVILSAYLSYVLFKDLHVDPFLSVLIVAPFMFSHGRAAAAPYVRRGRTRARRACSASTPPASGRSPSASAWPQPPPPAPSTACSTPSTRAAITT